MFVIVEGPNGSGKTSLIRKLSKNGYTTLSSPNGTPLAKMLRPVCRGVDPWKDVDNHVQIMLFSAARLDEYIKLVHDNDDLIISDRWWTSTYVYQCILQGLPVSLMEHTIHPSEKIDHVVILDANNDILKNRMEKERNLNPVHGKCKWTSDLESMFKVAEIYRNNLPNYLISKDIKNTIINTSKMNEDEVYNQFKWSIGI